MNQRPILISDCAYLMKAAGAKIWLLQKLDFGTQMRAEIGTRQLRVIIRSLTNDAIEIPSETNSCLFVVTSLAALKSWLQNFAPQQVF